MLGHVLPFRSPCFIARNAGGVPVAPRRPLAEEDVLDRPRTRIVVEQGDAQQHVALTRVLGDELRAADRAEVTVLARRRFVDAGLVLAAQPAEVFTRDGGVDVGRSGVRLEAGAAREQADLQPGLWRGSFLGGGD